MKLVISPRAGRRLREIQGHIALDADLNTALRVVLRIWQSVEMPVNFPKLAPEWDGGPTRALVVSGLPYGIHYRLLPDAVEIVTIVHTSQKTLRFTGHALPCPDGRSPEADSRISGLSIRLRGD